MLFLPYSHIYNKIYSFQLCNNNKSLYFIAQKKAPSGALSDEKSCIRSDTRLQFGSPKETHHRYVTRLGLCHLTVNKYGWHR